MAKADLEHAKLDHGEVHHVTSDEDFADGDPDLAAATSSASRISGTMQDLANSLQALQKEADSLVTEDAHVAKRPRTAPPKPEDQEMGDNPGASGPPFGKAD